VTNRPSPSTTAALVVVAVVFCVTMLSVVLSFLFAPEGSDAAVVIGPLLGTLAPTIAAVALLVQVRDVKDAQAATAAKVDRVAQDTHDLTNGLLDSKVRAGFADVAPHLVHPEARPLVEDDRLTRSRAHEVMDARDDL
jgi:hypothetical protein